MRRPLKPTSLTITIAFRLNSWQADSPGSNPRPASGHPPSYKRSMSNASVRTPAIIASPKYPRHLNCPRCGLSLLVQPHRAAIRHCPRCVGRNRVIVELFSSTLPADLLYDESSLPRVEGEASRSCNTASSVSISQSGGRHQRAQAVDKFRRTEPLALVAKRSMAISYSAIDERAASPRSRPRLAPWCTQDEMGEPACGMGIPHKYPGMEAACALLVHREGVYCLTES